MGGLLNPSTVAPLRPVSTGGHGAVPSQPARGCEPGRSEVVLNRSGVPGRVP